MKTEEHNPPHENEAEPAAVRFDDGAKRTARPVVPLDRVSLETGRERRRRGGKYPLGMILGLGLVTALAALANTFHRDERPPAVTAAATATAPDTPSTTPLDIAQAAAGAVSQAEAETESAQARAESDEVSDEAAAAPRITRGRTPSSFGYATEGVDRYEAGDVEELLARAERARKKAEGRAGRRRVREGGGRPRPRLIGVYTLRSRN
ncbi:MAG TPA: hypothetical protein VN256_22880 [Pyrinomonadaceae bacterium]|nr:hypothetical protein [Pyrinomonadaceae bacterium]